MCLKRPKLLLRVLQGLARNSAPVVLGPKPATEPVPYLSALAAMFNSVLLESFQATGNLNSDCLVWLMRQFTTQLLDYFGVDAARRLAALSFRLNQWVNLRGGVKFQRQIPWVSRLRHFRWQYPFEVCAPNVKRRRRA